MGISLTVTSTSSSQESDTRPDIMPKKGKAGSTFGRKTTEAKIMAKKRKEKDQAEAEEERERRRVLMALRRQHSDEREKQKLYEEERRKNKKFRDKERELDKAAHRESRDAWLARKTVQEEHQDAIIQENQAKLYYIHDQHQRQLDLRYIYQDLGFDYKRCDEPGYIKKWFDDLEKKDMIEWFRATCEDMWGRRCRNRCRSVADSCERCGGSMFHFGIALGFRATMLSLSHEWSDEVLDVIEKGPRCNLCQYVAVPHGIKNPSASPCQRCEISGEARAKLVDFWNHKQALDGDTTKFWIHSYFECVCEEEAAFLPIPEYSEEEDNEDDDKEDNDMDEQGDTESYELISEVQEDEAEEEHQDDRSRRYKGGRFSRRSNQHLSESEK